MIKVSYTFTHSFKIIRIPHPAIPFTVLPQPIQALRSGKGDEIEVPYIRCLNDRLPEVHELWALAEDGVREVHPYTKVRLLDDLREDNFHTHFFSKQQFRIHFLGRIYVNMSVKFIDATLATQQVGSRVASWTENFDVHSWGPYPTMIPHTVSTIKRHANNVPVTHALVLRFESVKVFPSILTAASAASCVANLMTAQPEKRPFLPD